ncbi:polysaccharide deacetylase family protein [Flavobacterium restrictum]|uniref:Polysaccharide deacetylase family protein n=1 Tax=Flavobacterium restrictum TaxID=2594428 RepID=A0A553DY73_9FLAO|nr:polysaccharide deacetylase family protein [Flavobacterium restrictum]TRX37749.1 polysaccharide deacetylase family protein [Flavobacterium restrictum]
MRWYWTKTNRVIKKLFRSYIWHIPNSENTIYLTFDDGPTPEVTSWVLSELKKNAIKATFFCIGKNIEEQPDIFIQTILAGHAIGNHTQNHLNGWQSTITEYLENAKLCHAAINEQTRDSCTLFRPPYGKIKNSQARQMLKLGYKIIMWDVLSADFDTTITPETCLNNVLDNVKSGSIIVFHDSVKAAVNMKYALPKIIEALQQRGFRFEALS